MALATLDRVYPEQADGKCSICNRGGKERLVDATTTFGSYQRIHVCCLLNVLAGVQEKQPPAAASTS